MLGDLRRLAGLLTPPERRRGALVVALVTAVALVEAAGVASIWPFLAVLADPAAAARNPAIAWLGGALGATEAHQLALACAGLAFAAILTAAVLRCAATWALLRYAHGRRHTLASRVLAGYLARPYAFFLTRHSAELAKTVLSEVDQLVDYGLRPALLAVAYALTFLCVAGLLVAAAPLPALIAAGAVAGAYAGVYTSLGRRIARIGAVRQAADAERHVAAAELLRGVKAIRATGRTGAHLARFRAPSARFAGAVAEAGVLGKLPRFVLEAVGLGLMMLLALVLVARGHGLAGVLPLLGLYALGGLRLLVAGQEVFLAASQLRFARTSLDTLAEALSAAQPDDTPPVEGDDAPPGSSGRAPEIVFEGVGFTYPGAAGPAVRGLTFRLPTGARVALAGPSGAGKTTVLDLLMGLLSPCAGTIRIDGAPLTAVTAAAWRGRIGYVPQEVFLADGSVADNVALGVSADRRDDAAVRAAGLAAGLDAVVAGLPDGYASRVGEGGLRLSGGQRQRIGIARALYADPDLLVLDEATAALDADGEAAVLHALTDAGRPRTVLLVSHRASALAGCTHVLRLEGGRLVAAGPAEPAGPETAAASAAAD
jgi:ABC-type multidrug transport system fused ATPase/permease subunit